MASTYSSNLGIELIGTGDQSGTWGSTTNTNLGTLIEQAISGYATQAVTTGADTTITIPNGSSGVARNMYIELTGSGGASTNLIVPANKKLYFIFNNTSSGQVTVKVSGQTGISVPNGKKMVLVSNGTDIVTAENYVASLSSDNLSLTGSLSVGTTSAFTGVATFTANPVLNGGTANGVLYLNGSKVATSGSALVFDGTNLGIGTTSPGYQLTILRRTGSTITAPLLNLQSQTSGSVDGDSFILFGTQAANWSAGVDQADSNKFRIEPASTLGSADGLTITTTGNLGIGTASPAYKLDVDGTINGRGLQASGTASLSFSANKWMVQNEGTSIMRSYACGADTSTYGRWQHYTAKSDGGATMVFEADGSGNLGLGVTPSAWAGKAFQIGNASNSGWASIGYDANGKGFFSTSAYNNTGSSWTYTATGFAATLYSADSGSHKWFNAPSGTAGNPISFTQAMTLDSSGNLGIGTASPGKNLEVAAATDTTIRIRNTTTAISSTVYGTLDWATSDSSAPGGIVAKIDTFDDFPGGGGFGDRAALRFFTNNSTALAERMRLDSSGNLGLGVTPSAWTGSGGKNIEIGATGNAIFGSASLTTYIYNANFDSSWKYSRSDFASRYEQQAGTHRWFTAPSGTAGNAISFTQAMTLDASGRLLVGRTTSDANGYFLQLNGTTGYQAGVLMTYSGVGSGAIFENSSGALVFGNDGASGTTERARITAAGSVVAGGSVALATTATDGFLYVPTCAGTPTGTPTAITGMAPIVVNTTNNKLYFYSGGAWRDAGP